LTWKEQALEHAQDLSPDEACGVIYLHKGKERFMPCKNIAFDKQNTFTIDPKDWAVAEEKGDIVGIFHSHTNCDPLPSDADKYSAEKLGLKIQKNLHKIHCLKNIMLNLGFETCYMMCL
jgi:proteasome lid subunit RPN8/RPN11